MITLKGDLGDGALQEICKGLTGADFPGPLDVESGDDGALCWMAPDEVLLLVPYDTVSAALGRLSEALGTHHHLAVDVSDARACFTVSGGAARDVMAKLTPVDVSPRAFQPGRFRRTRLAQVPGAFWMRDATTFEIIAFRSVADYVFELLSTAADPVGRMEFYT